MPKPVKRAKSFIGQYAGDFLSGNLAKSGMTKNKAPK